MLILFKVVLIGSARICRGISDERLEGGRTLVHISGSSSSSMAAEAEVTVKLMNDSKVRAPAWPSASLGPHCAALAPGFLIKEAGKWGGGGFRTSKVQRCDGASLALSCGLSLRGLLIHP